MVKKGLGKGLSALIPTSNELQDGRETASEIEISLIKPNSFQPRRVFDDEKLKELADSIKEHGVVQPVVVRALKNGKYELVVGERRLRACERLKLTKIPAVVRDFSNKQMMEIALVENIQRQDLNPVEEAYAYKRLMEEFEMTQEEVSARVAKSRSFVANMVRLLCLPDPVLEMLACREITIGHARALLAIESDILKTNTAQKVIDKKLSVRDTEKLVNQLKTEQEDAKEKSKKNKISPLLYDLENKLRGLYGTKVKIKEAGEKGRIEIDYYSNEDLERITAILLKEEES